VWDGAGVAMATLIWSRDTRYHVTQSDRGFVVVVALRQSVLSLERAVARVSRRAAALTRRRLRTLGDGGRRWRLYWDSGRAGRRQQRRLRLTPRRLAGTGGGRGRRRCRGT